MTLNRKSKPISVCLFSIILILLIVLVGCPDSPKFGVVDEIGRQGSGLGELDRPHGLVLRDTDTSRTSSLVLFVADYGNNRIQLSRDDLEVVISDSGSGPGQLSGPKDIAITQTLIFDRNRVRIPGRSLPDSMYIYVADTRNNRIQQFGLDGTFKRTWGSSGSDTGQFLSPTGIEVDFEGRVYVVDSGNHRIQVFDSDGNFLRMWGSQGSASGEFNSPLDVTVGYRADTVVNFIAVSDHENNRIQLFTSNGVFIRSFDNIPSPLGIDTQEDRIDIVSSVAKKLFGVFLATNSQMREAPIPETIDPYDVSALYYVSDRGSGRVLFYFGSGVGL